MVKVKLQILAAISIALSLISSMPITGVISVRGIPGPPGGAPTPGVDDPSNAWLPYGPRVNRLQMNFYSDKTTEFNEFDLGHLDLTDAPTSPSSYIGYDGSLDVVQTVKQPGYDMFEFDFNQANVTSLGVNTWAAWGCNFNHGNKLTGMAGNCGAAIRMAFAHLFDRDTWANFGPCGGACQAIADPSPWIKAKSPLAAQQSWELINGVNQIIGSAIPPADISPFETLAFHDGRNACITGTVVGFCSSAGPDMNFCEAANEILIASKWIQDAGGVPIATGKAADCTLTGISPGVAASQITMWVNAADPLLLNMGTGMAAAIDDLFASPVVNVVAPPCGIACLGAAVFITEPEGPMFDWSMATTGWTLPGPFADHLYSFYSSSAASNSLQGLPPDVCDPTQAPNGEPLNYGDVCIPTFDSAAKAAAQTTDLGVFNTQTLAALDAFGKAAANIPAYSKVPRTVVLRNMDGFVNQRGIGYSNFFTILNAKACPLAGKQNSLCNPTPTLAKYTFGGGDPTTLRWGQSQGTTHLNPLFARTDSELNVISEVYDTLFKASPIEPAKTICWMCQSLTQVVDSQGNIRLVVTLKQNLEFHNGAPLTAGDVAFSLLAMRDLSGSVFSGSVQFLIGVNVYSDLSLDIVMQGQSISHIVNLAAIPIIPQLIMGSNDNFYLNQGPSGNVGPNGPCLEDISTNTPCTAVNVSTVKLADLNPAYDPIAAGGFIGSGPFACISQGYAGGPPAGFIGGGCVKTAANTNGGQAIAPGSSMLLTKFDFATRGDVFDQYHRSYDAGWPGGAWPAITQSGQLQEFAWATYYNGAEHINPTTQDWLNALADVRSCLPGFDANGNLIRAEWTCADAAHWQQIFGGGPVPRFGSGYASLFVQTHYGDTWVWPYAWDPFSLENIGPSP